MNLPKSRDTKCKLNSHSSFLVGIDAYFETQYPVAYKTEVPYSTKVGLSTYSSFRFLRPLNVLFLRISSLFPANDLR